MSRALQTVSLDETAELADGMKSAVSARRWSHAEQVEDHKRWFWIWRRFMALNKCRRAPGGSKDHWHIDVGYCLDRYTTQRQGRTPQCCGRSRTSAESSL